MTPQPSLAELEELYGSLISQHRHSFAYRIAAAIVAALGLAYAVTTEIALPATVSIALTWLLFTWWQSAERLAIFERGFAVRRPINTRHYRWADVSSVAITYAYHQQADHIFELRLNVYKGRSLTIRMNWRDRAILIANLWPLLGPLSGLRSLHSVDEWQQLPRAAITNCRLTTRVLWPSMRWRCGA